MPKAIGQRVQALLDKLLPLPAEQTSVIGVAPMVMSDAWDGRSMELSSRRTVVYRDMIEIDDLMPEGQRALDILADNAVNAPDGSARSFVVRFDEGRKVSQKAQSIILGMVDRLRLQEKAYQLSRDTLKLGDNFQEVILADGRLERLMHLDPSGMRRNEDAYGWLLRGKDRSERNTCAYDQYSDTKFVTGFHHWQILHMRWGRSGGSKYGRPLLYTARYPFKKLQAMEEALVVNWLTRAFARLLFQLDATGKSPQETVEYMKAFKKGIESPHDVRERLSVVKDLYLAVGYQQLGGKYERTLNDVKVLDTSNTGFWNIDAVEYWRDKFITATGVPKAHMGLEQDVNARATLQWQDERFARTVRRVQMMMSETVQHLIRLELLLHGVESVRPGDYVIEWPTPSMLDEETRARTMLSYAQAATPLLEGGVISPAYIAQSWLKMTPSEWERVQEQQKEQINDANE